MNTIIGQRIQLVAITLIIIMALTRFGHVGSAFSLPDASLAVFFLAGFTVSGLGFLVLLLLEAGLIDYLAITQFNVSDFCMSPAYLCLNPNLCGVVVCWQLLQGIQRLAFCRFEQGIWRSGVRNDYRLLDLQWQFLCALRSIRAAIMGTLLYPSRAILPFLC